jgi:hypothetical protein
MYSRNDTATAPDTAAIIDVSLFVELVLDTSTWFFGWDVPCRQREFLTGEFIIAQYVMRSDDLMSLWTQPTNLWYVTVRTTTERRCIEFEDVHRQIITFVLRKVRRHKVECITVPSIEDRID